MEYITVFVTASSREEAGRIGRALVEEKLAACANIFDGVNSIYWWRGAVETANEVFLMLKTRRQLFAKLAARVKELHSYEVPEIVALPIVDGSQAYLAWIAESTK